MSSKIYAPRKYVENCFCFSTYAQYGFHNILHTREGVEKLSTKSPVLIFLIFKDFYVGNTSYSTCFSRFIHKLSTKCG